MEDHDLFFSLDYLWHPVTVSISLLIWVVGWSVLAIWLYHSPYDVIHKTKANALRIGIRLAMVVISAHILLFLSPAISVILVFVFGVLYRGFNEFTLWQFGLVLEWIMGWPSRDMATPRWNPIFPRRNVDGIDKAIVKNLGPASPDLPPEWTAAIGHEGKAFSRLTPSGKVRVDGATYPARTRGAFVSRGASVQVVDVDGFGLVVDECVTSHIHLRKSV